MSAHGEYVGLAVESFPIGSSRNLSLHLRVDSRVKVWEVREPRASILF